MKRSSRRISSKGPQYLDGIIAAAVSKSGFYSKKMMTYHGTYLELLEQDKRELGVWENKIMPFLKGYCLMKEISGHLPTDTIKGLTSQAVYYFDEFLSHQGINSEVGFLAAWQAARLGAQLDQSWPAVEEKLLTATEAHPERGEAIKEIVGHYIAHSEYKVAYIYTSYCMNTFLGYAPRKENKWGVDLPFYNWQVLEYHIPSCLAVGKKQQAINAYKTLKEIMNKYPAYFSSDDIERLLAYDTWFERDALVSETEGYNKVLSK